MNFLSRKRLIGLLLGLLALLMWQLASAFPGFIEFQYSRFFYIYLASVLAIIGSLLPMSSVGIGWLVMFGILLWIPIRHRDTLYHHGLKLYFYNVSLGVLAYLGLMLFLFMITFFLNHKRYSEEQLFGLDFSLTDEMNQQIDQHSVERANILVDGFQRDWRACSELSFALDNYDVLVASEQARFLESVGLPWVSSAEVKYFLVSGIWSGLGVSGQYQFLTGQPNIARNIPTFYKPIVMAHERAHLNGFASEAGANLLAMQTLFESSDARLQYIGLLNLWRKNPPKNINSRIVADLECWAEDWRNVKTFAFKGGLSALNDSYLKLSGHKDGRNSYRRGSLLARKYYYKRFIDLE